MTMRGNMAKYFGTDGIRGVYKKDLTEELAFKTGMALAQYFGLGEYIIVRDTRSSGPNIEDALIRGMYIYGAAVVKAGVLPTPACAYLTKKLNAKCGIVVSASHNPPEYNGIKVFDRNGLKIDTEKENQIEALIDAAEPPDLKASDIYSDTFGTYTVLKDAERQYIDYLIDECPMSLNGVKVGLDCGYGATASVAKKVFSALNAEVSAYNDALDGDKINCGCGALHPEFLLGRIKDGGIGFAFDGDGDRIAVVYDGRVIDGDTVLYNLARNITLKDNVVVGTVLNNMALERRLQHEGIKFLRTPVGDKYISNLLNERGYSLGGEQSGHFIINNFVPTGDALLTALYLLKVLYSDGRIKPFANLELYRQSAITVKASESILNDKTMLSLKQTGEKLLGAEGRIIVRMSGTEPAVRVMAEGKDGFLVDEIIGGFKKYLIGG
jgi:phosphoglucosamine mutase